MTALLGEDVGSILKEKRAARGLSLEQVAKAIRVKTQYLEAVETSYYEDAPAMVYLLGYIRKYAEYLQLDADAILDKFKAEQRRYRHLQDMAPVQPVQEDQRPKVMIMAVSALCVVVLLGFWHIHTRPYDFFGKFAAMPKAWFERSMVQGQRAKANLLSHWPGHVPHASTHQVAIPPAEIPPVEAKPVATHAPHKPAHTHPVTVKTPEVPAPSAAVQEDPAEDTKQDADKPSVAAPSSATPSAISPPAANALSAMLKPQSNAVPPHAGRLVLLAKGRTWVKILDKHNQLIAQAELSNGETFFAPDDKNIRVLAERPDLIEVYAEEGNTTQPQVVPYGVSDSGKTITSQILH